MRTIKVDADDEVFPHDDMSPVMLAEKQTTRRRTAAIQRFTHLVQLGGSPLSDEPVSSDGDLFV